MAGTGQYWPHIVVLPGAAVTIRFRHRRLAAENGYGFPPVRHLALASFAVAAVAGLTAFAYTTERLELLLSAVILAPVVAVAIYGLFASRAVETMRLALTDPLTGLGNARHFLERLERDLDRADAEGITLALCLVDIDDFKRVNDRFGHPAGDGVLIEVATCLRGGEAFRLGGDEFALLLPGRDISQAIAIAESVLSRVAASEFPHGGAVTASAGIAMYPAAGIERGGLVRAADRALYEAKCVGKDCVKLFTPGLTAPAEPALPEEARQTAFLFAARNLARAVAARGVRGYGDGQMVGDIAARIAVRMGLTAEHVELVRLGGLLSDVGKLALPDDVLQKPGPLTDHERQAVQRHPEIGFAMLDSLGADPVAMWIRYHHERWDGRGYPERLSGERIPLGARILFVADAFEAMTSDQAWRPKLTAEEALAEIQRCSGTQFDPAVVAALVEELGGSGGMPAVVGA
jgi:diguanylate cyclase (GGDEF)-like protein